MSGIDNGWLEAAIAWEVCASLHRQYCKGKDDLFTTRQSDFVKHAENAREHISRGQAPAGAALEPIAYLHDDGYWTPAKTDEGRKLNDRLLRAGSPKIGVYLSIPTAPSVLEDAAQGHERRHAIRQGHEIATSDAYFEARPQIDSNDRRKVFQAGFERGWDAAMAAKKGDTHE